MFRRLLTVMLLIPLSLNGLWVVCAEAEATEPVPQPMQAAPEAMPPCTGAAMCPLHKPAAAQAAPVEQDASQDQLSAQNQVGQPGAICLISPDGKGNSIAAIGFLYAPPAAVANLGAPLALVLHRAERASLTFTDTILPDDTPPPRA